jgi:SPASM domain peptide maturase of grasp-with-spasm system
MFKVASNCVIVDGHVLSTVCDLQFGKIILIHKETSSFLKENQLIFPSPEDSSLSTMISEDLRRIVDNGFLMPVDIPNVILEKEYRDQIDTLIIDISDGSQFSVKQIADIVDIGFSYIQFRLFSNFSISNLFTAFDYITDNNIKTLSIQVLMNYPSNGLLIDLEKHNKYPRFHSLILYNYDIGGEKDITNYNNKGYNFIIQHKHYKLVSSKDCGKIDTSWFTANLELYKTSKSCNTCLHGKVGIDTNGNIKNCPSMPDNYGNIKNTTLEEAINKPDFKKYWNVTKDQIEICKDCEFRYVCTDCRAYTERTTFKEELDLSKPLKCGYNPYTNEWAEWSTNPLKEKAIAYYGMEDLVKKNVK